MNLESPDATVDLNLSPELAAELRKLEKKRKLAEKRLLLWFAAPVLIIIPFVLAGLLQSNGVLIFAVAWIFVVLFGLGSIIHVVIKNTDEVSTSYKKLIVPKMLRIQQIEADYSMGHGLSVESFIKSNLYNDRYSHFERYDSLIGKYKGYSFGLYELAVQVAGGRSGGPTAVGATPGYKLLTTHFYGWVLHVPIRKMAGKTYIIPLARKTKEECDDWVKATGEFVFQKSGGKQIYSGDAEFDKTFGVCTTNEAEAKALLQAPFRHFLMEVHRLLPGAAAYSFIDGRAYMHCGIQGNSFDLQRGQAVYPAQTEVLVKRLRFFCAIILALRASADNARA